MYIYSQGFSKSQLRNRKRERDREKERGGKRERGGREIYFFLTAAANTITKPIQQDIHQIRLKEREESKQVQQGGLKGKSGNIQQAKN